MRRELVTVCTSGGCDQFETSPEAIEQELRPALCERSQTNYSVDMSGGPYDLNRGLSLLFIANAKHKRDALIVLDFHNIHVSNCQRVLLLGKILLPEISKCSAESNSAIC